MQLAIAQEEYDHFKSEANRTLEQQKTVNPLEGMEIDQGNGRKMVLYDPACGGCSYLVMAEGETAGDLFGRRLADGPARITIEDVNFDPESGAFDAAIKAPPEFEGQKIELGMKFEKDFSGVAEAK